MAHMTIEGLKARLTETPDMDSYTGEAIAALIECEESGLDVGAYYDPKDKIWRNHDIFFYNLRAAIASLVMYLETADAILICEIWERNAAFRK
jgi:hypothetical protein